MKLGLYMYIDQIPIFPFHLGTPFYFQNILSDYILDGENT